MLPDPLHPALVHLPLALAVLLPLFAILGALVLASERLPHVTWAVIVLLQLLLVGSAWLAVQSGEREEERVERTVAEAPIEEHEERAETLLRLAGVGVLLSVLGGLGGVGGQVGRAGFAAFSLVILVAAVRVGHTGGELVYQHGAASEYVSDLTATTSALMPGRHDRASQEEEDEEDDEEDDD